MFNQQNNDSYLLDNTRVTNIKNEIMGGIPNYKSKGIRPLTAKIYYKDTLKRMASRHSNRGSEGANLNNGMNVDRDYSETGVKFVQKHQEYNDARHHNKKINKNESTARRSFQIKTKSSTRRDRQSSACRHARLSNMFERNYKSSSSKRQIDSQKSDM